MSQDKSKRYMMLSSSIFTALFAGLIGFPISMVSANAAQANAPITATFRTKCAMCHGEDGGGSEVGKSMNVPDLRAEAVQGRTDMELIQIISSGKGGMPSFKNSLSTKQMQALVKHVRALAKKK